MLKYNYKNHLLLFLLGLLIFIFYLFCMPKTVALEDDGNFLLAAYFNGISHPPGYPLHSLLGYLFVHLPFGNPATNGHAMSAFFSALSGVLIFIITAQLTCAKTYKSLTPYIAALAYTLSTTIWSQSIITEVYTLNTFLFLCVLYIALYIKKLAPTDSTLTHTGHTFYTKLKPAFFLIGLFSGLAISNHWPLFILGSIGVVFLLIENYKTVFLNWYLIFLGLCLGLTPYLWLYINSNSDTFIQFYGPLQGFGDLYSFISREHFNESLDFSPTATLTDKFQFTIFTLSELVNQWGVVNTIFVPIGIVVAFSIHKDQKRNLQSILISYLTTSVLLSIILGYDFNQDARENLPPFFVLTHSLGAIFFAIGVNFCLSSIQKVSNKNFTPIFLFIIVLQALIANFNTNFRANYNWTTLYAKQVLDTLKPNSTLFVSGDIGTGVIGYWHFIKGYRPDITVIQDDGLVLFGTRLFNPKKTTPTKRDEIILSYIKSSNNPVYFLNQLYKVGINDFWLVYEYNKDVEYKKQRLQSLSKAKQQYLNYIFSDISFTDYWTQLHLNVLRAKATPYLMNQLSLTNDDGRKLIKKYLLKSTNNLPGAFILLKHVYEMKYAESPISTGEIIKLGWDSYHQADDKKLKALYLNLLARINFETGNIRESYNLYTQSTRIWPHNNIAHEKLLSFKNSAIVKQNKKKTN